MQNKGHDFPDLPGRHDRSHHRHHMEMEHLPQTHYPPTSGYPPAHNYPSAGQHPPAGQYPPAGNHPPGQSYPLVNPHASPVQGGAIQQQPINYPPQAQPSHPMSHTMSSSHTVVVQQPQQYVVQETLGWSTELCDCCSDMNICCLGCFCPCCLAPYVSCKADECCCAGWCCPIALRATIRAKYNIPGDLCEDCCSISCNGTLSFCQMARELKIRNLK